MSFRIKAESGLEWVIIESYNIPERYWARYASAWHVATCETGKIPSVTKYDLPENGYDYSAGGASRGLKDPLWTTWAAIPPEYDEPEENELGLVAP